MSYISLYRKYRPHKFSDVVGQEVVIKILQNSIIENKIGHAYIFSGPRGTGKTSVAKIFAKAVNCLNNKKGDVCGKCDVCNKDQTEEIDIVEIDAASNNGVDEIREIRNNVKLLPSLYKYKVYIIDEVHMLSTSAFNALLKTLEEPPSHVIFILATTEFNKIPITVISRCQKFDFKKIKTKDIIKRLEFILKEENKELDNNIIEFIAKVSDGGLRDAINLLDQVLSLNKEQITLEDVYLLIGYIEDDSIFNLLEQMFVGDITNTLKYLDEYTQSNKNLSFLCSKLIDIVKDIIIYCNTNNYFSKSYEEKLNKFSTIDIDQIIKVSEILLNLQNELRRSSNQKIIFEVYLLRIVLLFNKKEEETPKNESTIEKKEAKKPEIIEKKEEDTPKNEVDKTPDIIEQNDDEIKKIRINNAFSGANKELKTKFVDKFDSINDYISQKEYTSLANLLLKSTPEVVSDKNILFTFKKNIDANLFNLNIEEIQKLLKLIYKKKYSIIAITNEEWQELKKEYINNIKNDVKYEYIEEKVVKKAKNTELQMNMESIFGEEFIKEE